MGKGRVQDEAEEHGDEEAGEGGEAQHHREEGFGQAHQGKDGEGRATHGEHEEGAAHSMWERCVELQSPRRARAHRRTQCFKAILLKGARASEPSAKRTVA